MRFVWPAFIAVTAGIAHADTGWSEYGTVVKLRAAQTLTEQSCELDVTLHGAIAEVEQRVRLANPGPDPLAATTDFSLPDGAQLVGLELKRGNRAADAAVAVGPDFLSERVSSPAVLDADPAIVSAIDPLVDGRPRYRLILQPIDPEHEVTITTRWIRAADIRGGALHLVLPARDGKPCRGTVHAKPGPSTSVARVRAGGVETKSRTFTVEDKDVALAVDLVYRKLEPIVWTQSESIGDGLTAQAITVLTPPARASTAKRVLFVIDGSRSMELIGRHRIKQLVHSLAGVLARGTEVDALIYDRASSRVLGSFKPIDAQNLAAIETAIDTHTAGNGSNTQAALTAAQQAIAGARDETQIVLVTDGVMSDDAAPSGALATLPVELHAIVLSNGRMRSPEAQPLRTAINRIGGSFTELDVAELDTALALLDDWLRPSWLELRITSNVDLPAELRAGSGVVLTAIEGGRPRRPTLTGHTTKLFKTTATAAPQAPIAELALSRARYSEISALAGQGMIRREGVHLGLLRDRHPVVDQLHTFVVLATQGKIAKSRREVTKNGGPFTRMTALPDPEIPAPVRTVATPATGGSAIDGTALELLFKTQLQPAAFACYQRALGRAPKLAGTVKFQLVIGRGETTHVSVAGLGDATFDACLVDAAYTVTPSLPNPAYNTDDQTIANYPLTFSLREQKPFVVAGDADSSSPLDIDSIQGGVPVKIKAGDTSTPLGNLRPPKTP